MPFLSKIFVFGFITWLVPFIVSFFFFRDGQMTIPETFFKSIMIVVSMLTGAVLILTYFRSITSGYIRQGILLGCVWLVINLGLDLLLVNRGFFPMTYYQYFTDIGVRYLAIPIFTITVGGALAQKRVIPEETGLSPQEDQQESDKV